MSNPRRHRRHGRHHRRHYHNPGGAPQIMDVAKHPVDAIKEGGTAIVTAFLTVSLPNLVGLGFVPAATEQDTVVNKALRAGARLLAGGLVYGLMRRFMPGEAAAARIGVAAGSIGALVFDIAGTRLILGRNDETQTPQMLLAGFLTPTTGTAAYLPPRGSGIRPGMGIYAQTRRMIGSPGFGPTTNMMARRNAVRSIGLYGAESPGIVGTRLGY